MKKELWSILIFLLGTFAGKDSFEKVVLEEICNLECSNDNECQKNCTESPEKIAEISEPKNETAGGNARLVCRDTNFIVLDHNPGIFVIDYRPVGSVKWIATTAIRDPLTYLHELFPGKSYEYRIHRILENGYSKPEIVGPIATFSATFRTLREVKNVSLSEFKTEDNDPHHLKVDVSFSPSEDQNCRYEVVLRDNGNRNTLILFNETMKLRTTFGSLEFGTDYVIEITSLTYKNNESPKILKEFRTPTCLDFHNNLILCQPPIVKGLNATTIRRGENIFDVIVTWNTPDLIPDFYEISLGEVNSKETDFRNVSGNSTEVIFPTVKIIGMTDVSIRAVSAGGASPPHFKHLKIPETPANFLRIIIMGAIAGMVILIIGTGVFACYKHGRRKLNKNRHGYFEPLSEKDGVLLGPKKEVEVSPPEPIIVVTSPVMVPEDKYEINRDNLEIDKVLGTGAFGVVKLGTLRDDRGRVTPVAIKMLRKFPDAEAVRSFEHEIKLMKSTGNHPNIVSLIGCCTRGTPRLLIVEYCSRGDLETFLKNATICPRERVVQMRKQWSTIRRLHGYQNEENIFRESVSVSMKTENDLNVNNFIANCAYGFDQDTFNDTEIVTMADLLNFGRQIATGMEFLASIKVLHRDLAARNVLLCNDWTVKISDFGLSRDIYQENVYKKQGDGRLPIKWMAIESLTHQTYNMYSDVWSFGILLWEIVTLGGNPYPGIPTTDILVWLQSGNRMQRPENCSLALYDVMLSCWKSKPKDRPTFTFLKLELDKLLSEETADNEYLVVTDYSSERL